MSDRLEAALAALVDALRAELRAAAAPVADAPDRLLSVDEAAAALDVARSTLYGEITGRRLRSLKVGRRRLIPSSALADYIAAAERAA